MNENLHHRRTETDQRHSRTHHWQTTQTTADTGADGKADRESTEHLFSNGKETRTHSTRGSDRHTARTRARYVYHRATDHVSGFWYALATFDLILAIILFFCVVLTDTRPLECPVIHIEHIYKAPVYDSGEHVEELDTETLLDESKVYMLAHLIGGEAGADWCTDELQLMVGSVVLNRIASDRFPNTMEEVIFQKGQYSVTWNGAYENEPTERTVANAKYLLLNGPTIPEDVLFQANFPQGKTYKLVQGVYFGR